VSAVWNTIVPVFAVVALGFGLGGRRRLDVGTLADLALLVTSPALLFSVLAGSRFEAGQWAVLVGGTLFVAAGTAGLAVGYARWSGAPLQGCLLTSVFWNAGNLPLPTARLAFGEAGLEAAAIVFVAMAVLTSTAGIWIAKGEGGLREVFRMPLVWASAAGIAVGVSGVALPRMLLEPVEMVGDMAIPLMLLNLGVQLRRLVARDWHHAAASVAIRIGGGGALGLAFVALLGVEGVDRQVLLLDAVMPAAVINVVMAQRYGADPDRVAAAIVLGTLVSAALLPVVLYALL